MPKPFAVSVWHGFADSLALSKSPSNTSGGRTRSVLYPTHAHGGHFSLRSNRRRQQSPMPLESLCLDGLPRFSPVARIGGVSHGENPRTANTMPFNGAACHAFLQRLSRSSRPADG